MGGISYELNQLDNGATLCAITADQAQSVRLGIGFPYAGDYYSIPPETGHVVEHMIFKGASNAVGGPFLGGPRAFRQAIERNGSIRGAWTYPERMQYSLTSPARGYREAVDSFVRGIEAPLLGATNLPKELKVVRDELVGYTNDEHRVLWHELMRAIGREAPDPAQVIAQLGLITPDDLREHHNRTHRTEGMYVAVLCPPNVDMDFIKQRFANIELERQAPQPKPDPTSIQPEQPVLVERDITNVYYSLGRFGMNALPYSMAASVHLLEGYLFHYQDAAIYEGARDKGLAYSVAGDIQGDEFGKDRFRIEGRVAPDNAPALLRFIADRLHNTLHTIFGLTPRQFEEVRENKIGSLILQYENIGTIHALAMGHLRKYGTAYHPNDILKRLEYIAFDDFQNTVRRLFTGGVAVAGALGKDIQRQPELIAALQEAQDLLASL